MKQLSNLIERLEYWSKTKQDVTAFTFIIRDNNEQTITYGALAKRAKIAASKLQQLGLVPGDRAILAYEPGIDYIVSFLSCLYAGVLAVPLYPPLTKPFAEKFYTIIENCSPKLILADCNIRNKIIKNSQSGELANIEFIQDLIDGFNLSPDSPFYKLQTFNWLETDNLDPKLFDHYKIHSINKEDIAFLQYTSGSTGNPKGVMVSHYNIVINNSGMVKSMGINESDRIFSWLPPYHDMGLIGNILAPAYVGCSAFLISPIDFLSHPLRWLKMISKYRINVSGGPNLAYALSSRYIRDKDLLDIDLSCWRIAFNGAEPVQLDIIRQFCNKFKFVGFSPRAFYPCYGMAEATLYISGRKYSNANNYLSLNSDKLKNNIIVKANKSDKSVDLVNYGISMMGLKIVNPESLEELPDDRVGEIWITGDSVTRGYWGLDDLTKATFKAKLKNDKANYLRTGDLGFLHQDNLYITGRLKDLIIIKGMNYYPQDIEQTMQSIEEASNLGNVVAFSIPGVFGEVLCICAEYRRNKFDQEDLNNLVLALRKAILYQHTLATHRILILPPKSLLKTTSGKIRRKSCRNILLNKGFSPYLDWESDEYEAYNMNYAHQEQASSYNNLLNLENVSQYEAIINLIIEGLIQVTKLPTDKKISPDTNIFDFGITSIMAVELSNFIAHKFNSISILPISIMYEKTTIRDLADYLQIKLNNGAELIPTNENNIILKNSPKDVIECELSFAQKRLWLNLEHYENISFIFKLGRINQESILKSLKSLLNRHTILRTLILTNHEQYYQKVFSLEEKGLDIVNYIVEDMYQLDKVLYKEVNYTYNLSQEYPIKISCYEVNKTKYMSIVIHHIAFDGWSANIFAKDFCKYCNYFEGKTKFLDLPPSNLQYKDFILWQKKYLTTELLDNQLSFWKNNLLNFEKLKLHIDKDALGTADYPVKSVVFKLEDKLSRNLRILAKTLRVSLYSLLLSGCYLLLRHYSDQDDILIGGFTFNRHYPGSENIIGLFTNRVLLRTKINKSQIIHEYIKEVHYSLREVQKNQDIPFIKVLEALDLIEAQIKSPLFQFEFLLQSFNSEITNLLPEIQEYDKRFNSKRSIDLSLCLNDKDTTLKGYLEYATHLYKLETIEKMLNTYKNILEQLTLAGLNTTISELTTRC